MPGFLKGSIIIGLFAAVFRTLKTSYGTSRLKGFVNASVCCFKDCIIYRLCSKYFNKPYYFEYSLTLRFIKWVVAIVDIPMSLTGRFVKYITGGSEAVLAVNAVAETGAEGKLKITGAIGVFISLGFGAGLLIKGSGAEAFIAPWVILVISLVLIGCGKGYNFIKNSLIYRFIVWLVKA